MAPVLIASTAQPKGFALACQLNKSLGPEVDYTALRRRKNYGATRLLGIAQPTHLPFREAPHRGYGSAAELFAGLRPNDRIALNLADALERLIADTRPNLILAPQVTGGHIDHIHVVRAFQAALPPLPILWLRDLPYKSR